MKRPREQAGYVYRRAGWWVLRYRESLLENGQLVRRQLAKRIEPVAPEHQRLKHPPQCVLDSAKKMLEPVNNHTYTLEATQTISNFFTNIYLPHLSNHSRASTVAGYRRRWCSQLLPRCGSRRLLEFRTPQAHQLLADVARQNPNFKRSTMHHFKTLLSGMFKFAIQQGYIPGPNPMREAGIPKAVEGEETYAYSLDEVTRMLLYLPQPAYAIAAVAAFTGLRRGEIAGLLWENYDGVQISVRRSVWEGHVDEPKTRKSKAPVPVIPALRRILDSYREQCGNPTTGVMFPTSKGTPLSLNNVLNRTILPVLNVCMHCKKPEDECGKAKNRKPGDVHVFQCDVSRPEWHGWHAFRRGLATNLHTLGVDDKTIQAILRHSNVAVTQNCYVKSLPEQSIAAMKLLESLMCADRALEKPPASPVVVN